MIPPPPTFTTWEEEQQWAFANLPLGFPHLKANGFQLDNVTSPWVIHYNCVAYAAKDETRWWWPSPLFPGAMYQHWPEGIPRENPPTVQNFYRAFETLGFEVCSNEKHEIGFEKVAIYVDSNDIPQHMARELGDGVWCSKLGQLQDICHHKINGVECADYGVAKYFMKKPLEGYSRLQRIMARIKRVLHLS